MGADSGMSGSVSRGGAMLSSDVPLLPQCLPLEPISLGSQKYTRSGELRRALGFPLGSASEDHSFRVSSYKPSPPVATEELKQFKENVLDASVKAKERSKMLCESIFKLEKYRDAMGSKKRQRAELPNEKPGGPSLLKMTGQPSRNLLDQSAQRLEDKAKCSGLNKRFRSSAGDPRADSRSGSLSKDQICNGKDTNVLRSATGGSVQQEERTRRLSAVGEGWDKMKRKRSVGTVASRSTDTDVKRTTHSKLSSESKLTSCDPSTSRSNANHGISIGSPNTVVKGKLSRAPRSGSVLAVNSSDVQASSEACEGWEQPASANKVISLGLMQNNHRTANSSHTLEWGGHRQKKSSRSRRTNVVPPVSNHDDGQNPSLGFTPPGNGATNCLNGTSACLNALDVHSSTQKSKLKVERASSPARLSESEETRGLEKGVEEKGIEYSDMPSNGKGKARPFLFPTKRNKNVVNDKVVDGVRRQGRTMRGLSLPRPGVSECEAKSENVSTIKPVQSMRPDKNRSKTGRPPSKKMSDGKAVPRTSESDDDHEELLAAAASARKSSYLSCTGRFWKKMEPVFGSISSQATSYLKQQLSFAQELEDSLSQTPNDEYNIMGVYMPKEIADVPSQKQGRHFCQLAAKDDGLSEGVAGGGRLDKFSSFYQRVLSALIEEDECDGISNVNDGVSLSFQCASEDSHCGSCNYADAETRDRDRLDSEAESVVDFQVQKRCAGDRFSCNKSVTSNTTRNASMSDSLHSSGRWLGDEGLSHSDVEFVSGNDQAVVPRAVVTLPENFSACEYQLMCVDERLILELQSIGLYLDTMPDLAEGEELINRDITELKEGLFEQVEKTKHNLVKIEKAMQDDIAKEKQYIEQVAMEQLIHMAYKRRMACRRNNASKTVMRKVSKQVAMGFIERTLARCKNFELTGHSCFSEPALRNVLFTAPEGNDAGIIVTDVNAFLGGPKHRPGTTKSDSTSLSMLDSCVDDPRRGSTGTQLPARHSSENGFVKIEPMSQKGKKRELLLDDVAGATAFDGSHVRGAKGRRTERDRDHSRDTLTANPARENKKSKYQHNSASAAQPLPASSHQQISGGNRNREMGLSSSRIAPIDDSEELEEPIDFSSLPMPDFDSIEQLGVSNDPSATQDIGFWLDGLQEDASEGLHIPMDDLNMINF